MGAGRVLCLTASDSYSTARKRQMKVGMGRSYEVR
jgi:hypothetical protein